MEWSSKVFEAIGNGESLPDEPFSEGYFSGMTPKGQNWKYVIKYHGLRHGQYNASVTIFYFPIADVYLEDGSVTFSKDGIVRKNFTVGQIPINRFAPEWTRVFSVPNIRLSYDRDGEPFTVHVRYRVDKSYKCACTECDFCVSMMNNVTLLNQRVALCRLNCPLKPQPPQSSPQNEPPPPPPLPKNVQFLISDFQKLLFSSASSDVTFKIGDESVPAHELVLTTRVPYFKTLFASGMKEATSKVITIEDADIASFKELLKFIYSGELPENLSTAPETYLLLAEKYDIQDLKSCCTLALKDKLASGNVVEILILAHLCHCANLKEECFRRLKEWKSQLPKEELEPLTMHAELMLEFIQAT